MVTTRSQSQERVGPAVTGSSASQEREERENDDEDIPENVLKAKEKLEKETGKKYRYRPAKKDLPSVGDLLKHGVPGKENQPSSWKESVKTALLLAVVFALSLLVFHHTILSKPSNRKAFKLPNQKRAEAAMKNQQQQQQAQQEVVAPEKEKVVPLELEETEPEEAATEF